MKTPARPARRSKANLLTTPRIVKRFGGLPLSRVKARNGLFHFPMNPSARPKVGAHNPPPNIPPGCATRRKRLGGWAKNSKPVPGRTYKCKTTNAERCCCLPNTEPSSLPGLPGRIPRRFLKKPKNLSPHGTLKPIFQTAPDAPAPSLRQHHGGPGWPHHRLHGFIGVSRRRPGGSCGRGLAHVPGSAQVPSALERIPHAFRQPPYHGAGSARRRIDIPFT